MKFNIATLFSILLSFISFSQSNLRISDYPTANEVYISLCKKPVQLYQANRYSNKININDSIRDKLVSLLNFHWTADEIEEYLANDFKNSFTYKGIEKDADNLSYFEIKKNYIQKINEYNKLVLNIRNQALSILIKNHLTKINPDIVYLIGSLDIKKAIPNLKLYLKDTIQYDKLPLQIALARLGDSAFQKFILNSDLVRYDNKIDDREWFELYMRKTSILYYINTQESIYSVSNWLDTSKNFCTLAHGCGNIKASNFVVDDLCKIIKNEDFRNGINSILSIKRKDFFNWENDLSIKVILFCKNWLQLNKGKYDLVREYMRWQFPK
jgi:hypothetical protein